MQLKQAEKIAAEIVAKLAPICEEGRCVVAGSIRRKKTMDIHDIDMVVIPRNQGEFITACQAIGKLTTRGVLSFLYGGTTVDLYIATPKTWATLLLIRTGSKEHNIKMCRLALNKGMTLKADGSGLFLVSTNKRVAGETEESIFVALGLKYVEPEMRR